MKEETTGHSKKTSFSLWATGFEWFWRTQELQRVTSLVHHQPDAIRTAQQTAKACIELADRTFDPVEPLRAGSGLPFALSLYREGAYWALVANQSQIPHWKTLTTAFEESKPELIFDAAGNSDNELQKIQRALLKRSFVETAALPVVDLATDATAAKRFVHALLARSEEPGRKVAHVWRQRWSRTITFGVGTIIALSIAATWGVRHRIKPINLAAGRPWRTSSIYRGFSPQNRLVDGNASTIFFHTDEEDSPWWEVDLQSETIVHEVNVTNRSDGFEERAIPLLMELSHDQSEWVEVGRRTTGFDQWSQAVGGRGARYVRLRALKRTWLHLEGVAVR